MASQSTHLNIAEAGSAQLSCIPVESDMLLCLTAEEHTIYLRISGQQFEAWRACFDAFAATGTAQHHYAITGAALDAVAEIAAVAA